jgi:hypothetical protein
VNSLIENKCKDQKRILENNRDYPHSVKLVILHELGLIDDELYSRLDGFRKLRNDAAYKVDFHVGKERITNLAFKSHPAPSDISMLCMAMVGVLWNKFTDIYTLCSLQRCWKATCLRRRVAVHTLELWKTRDLLTIEPADGRWGACASIG